MEDKLFYSLKEASKKIGVSYSTIRRIVLDDKDLPYHQIRGQRRIHREDIAEYLKSTKVNPIQSDKK